MKPIIHKLWMVMAVVCLSISASAYDFEADGIFYTITSTAELTCEVSGSSDRSDRSDRSDAIDLLVINLLKIDFLRNQFFENQPFGN